MHRDFCAGERKRGDMIYFDSDEQRIHAVGLPLPVGSWRHVFAIREQLAWRTCEQGSS
jgi:hypothetical protein